MGLEAHCPALAVLLGWVGNRADQGTAGRRGGTKVIRLDKNGPGSKGSGRGTPRRTPGGDQHEPLLAKRMTQNVVTSFTAAFGPILLAFLTLRKQFELILLMQPHSRASPSFGQSLATTIKQLSS
jgi:hypothetical protein